MTRIASTIALLVAGLTSPAFAQDSSRKDFQEFCQALEGRFVGEVTWVTDWPGIGKKGEKVTCYFEGRIAEDGNVLTGRWYGGAGSGTGQYYFDAAAKQINYLWINSGGAFERGILYKKDGHWVETGSGSLADGRKTAHTSTLAITDNGNTHTYTGSGTVRDEKTDDRHDVWRRVSR